MRMLGPRFRRIAPCLWRLALAFCLCGVFIVPALATQPNCAACSGMPTCTCSVSCSQCQQCISCCRLQKFERESGLGCRMACRELSAAEYRACQTDCAIQMDCGKVPGLEVGTP